MADLSSLSDAELEAIVTGSGTAAPYESLGVTPDAAPTMTMASDPASQAPSWYAPKQLGFDLLAGMARAGYGIADLATTPLVFLANQENANLPYFGLSKMGAQDIEQAGKYLGVNPDSTIQEAVSFAAPTPLSKAKLGSQILTGLGSYLGYKGVEGVTGSETAGALAGVLAPGMATKASSRYSTAVKALAGDEDALRQLAQKELLTAAGEEGAQRLRNAQEIPSLGLGSGNSTLTAAEIAQSPGLAAYQQQARLGAQGKLILEPAIQQREAEIGAALTRVVGDQPQVGELSLALRGVSDAAERSKAAKENELLMSLMPSEDLAGMSRLDRGEALAESLKTRSEASDAAVKEAWQTVPQKTKIAAGSTILSALREFNSFGDIAKERISGTGKAVVDALKTYAEKAKTAKATDKQFNLTVKELQDLRSFAGVAQREAQGINPREVAMMTNLKSALDKVGLKQAQTEGATSAVEALQNAIKVTAKEKETFTRGVTGELLQTRRFQPQIKVSRWVDKILAAPENIAELGTKFGKDSPELAQIRAELLDRVSAAENPQAFVTKNRDLFTQAFQDDAASIEQYAASKAAGTGLEEFKNVTDTVIPSKVFADFQSAKEFAAKFGDTPILDWTRRKFIDQKIVRGDVLKNLEQNKAIAKELFGDSYSAVEKVLNDVAISRSPAELERLASKGQSITGQRLTAIGQLASFRGTLQGMEKGSVPLMTALGLGSGMSSSPTLGALGGTLGGLYMRQISTMRQDTMNKFVAELLADPKLLQFAAAPPTASNMQKLLEAGVKTGYLKALGQDAEPTSEPVALPSPISPSSSVDLSALSDAELEAMVSGVAAPTPEIPAAKKDIGALVADKSPLIKAMIRQESNFDPNAQSKAGAGGLMQLMPSTAKGLGVEDVFDPEQNLAGGEKYINQMLSKFKSKPLALAAYNWGPANVRKAIHRLERSKKPVTWTNLVRYTSVPQETIDYVSKVLKYEQEYGA